MCEICREIEALKADHAAELRRERAEKHQLQETLLQVREMRDLLLEKHQVTETKLTHDANGLIDTIRALEADVERRDMHIEHRAKVNAPSFIPPDMTG